MVYENSTVDPGARGSPGRDGVLGSLAGDSRSRRVGSHVTRRGSAHPKRDFAATAPGDDVETGYLHAGTAGRGEGIPPVSPVSGDYRDQQPASWYVNHSEASPTGHLGWLVLVGDSNPPD